MNNILTVPVDLDGRGYDILIGAGLLDNAGEKIAAVAGAGQLVVITDATVATLHLDKLLTSLVEAGRPAKHLIIEPGEQSKNFAQLEPLLEQLLSLGVERGSTVIALGGGVVGDLAGFTASIALRGIGFIQVPTTLLAQVDSSVGGKTGINSRHGKNTVGSFYQPQLVLADTATLDSLPPRELRAGYAEVVKTALIDDPAFFAWLESNGAALIAGDQEARRHAVGACCRSKARVVAADEREAGQRQLLNLGHTFGHAFEAESGYDGSLLHGEAVAIGTVLAFDLSVRLGLCPPQDLARVRSHLEAVGLPTAIGAFSNRSHNVDALYDHMTRDKKARAGRLTFILARGIGGCYVTNTIEESDVRATLSKALAA
ncbi:MAG: 3-dehydroquinate synthase [Alphaproteobacteria bacterium]